MLLEPPIDELVGKMGNPFKLAVIVGKRAKFLSETLTEEQKSETILAGEIFTYPYG